MRKLLATIKKTRRYLPRLTRIAHWHLKNDRLVQMVLAFIILIELPILVSTFPTLTIDLPMIETATNSRDILITVIQSLAQILGLVGALVLITFQLHRSSFHAIAMKSLFDRGIIRDSFFFYLFSISYSLLGLLVLNDVPQTSDLVFVLISTLLFVVALFLLVPLIKKVYSYSGAAEQADDQLSMLQYDHLRVLAHYKINQQRDYWDHMAHNPIVVVTNATVVSMIEGDDLGVSQVIAVVNQHLFEKFKKTSDPRQLLNAFIHFYESVALQSIRSEKEVIQDLIVETIKEIHHYAAVHQFSWEKLTEFNRFIEDTLSLATKKSASGYITQLSHTLQFINEWHLEHNCPAPDELLEHDGGTLNIADLSPGERTSEALQWRHITHDYMRMMFAIAEQAINQSQPRLATHFSHSLARIADKTIGFDHLTDEMKGRIIGWAYYYSATINKRIIDFQQWDLVTLPFPFEEHSIDRALNTQAEFSKKMLQQYSESLLDVCRGNVIDTFQLNQYGAFGRGLTRSLGDKLHRQAFKYVLMTFNEMRKIIEKGEQIKDSNDIYIELHKQVESLKNWLKNNNGTTNQIRWVNRELKKFNTELLKKVGGEKYTIDWQDRIR